MQGGTAMSSSTPRGVPSTHSMGNAMSRSCPFAADGVAAEGQPRELGRSATTEGDESSSSSCGNDEDAITADGYAVGDDIVVERFGPGEDQIRCHDRASFDHWVRHGAGAGRSGAEYVRLRAGAGYTGSPLAGQLIRLQSWTESAFAELSPDKLKVDKMYNYCFELENDTRTWILACKS